MIRVRVRIWDRLQLRLLSRLVLYIGLVNS